LKNFGPRGNSLLVRAVTASGRDALGARLTVTTGKRKQIDEVRSGGYHISQGDFRVHFGVGQAIKADIGIRWPAGAVETFKGVETNQWIVVREGKGIVERHPFSRDPGTSIQR
jgi:hypothetical protein